MGIPFGISLFIYGIVPFAAQGQPLYIYTPVAYLETLALTSCLQVRILLCPSSLANRILSPALSRASGSFCLRDQISARASTSAVLPLRVILSRSTQVVTLSQSFPFRSRRASSPTSLLHFPFIPFTSSSGCQLGASSGDSDSQLGLPRYFLLTHFPLSTWRRSSAEADSTRTIARTRSTSIV